MSDGAIRVGLLLSVSTLGFKAGCRVMLPDLPAFGSFVRAAAQAPTSAIYGLIYDVAVQDDPFSRRFVIAEPPEEVIRDQQKNRQVPIEVGVLAVGYAENGRIVHRLPPQPPVTMEYLYPCTPDEVVAFTRRFDYFRLVLNAPGLPADELLAASLWTAAAARPVAERRPFLVEAGRELARLLAVDPLRLDGLLKRIRP